MFREKKVIFLILVLFIFILSGCNRDIINIQTPLQPENDNQWEPISRARYTEGKVLSLIEENELVFLKIKVEQNYHSSADPIDDPNFPFKRGELVKIMLEGNQKISLKRNTRIIILGSQVSNNNNEKYYGGTILYYEKDGVYYDLDGNIAELPFNVGD